MSAQIYSELIEDYFITNIKGDLFQDSDETQQEQEEHTNYAVTTFEVADANVRSVTIEHSVSSSVDLVGLQVWRGALLLADYIMANPSVVRDQNVLELAAGTGLTSITAGLFAKSVVATDVDRGEILSLLQTNADHNKQSLANCDFKVKELDFFWEEWPSEVTTLAQQSDLILAADVVYDKNITIHFFKTLRKLLAMSPKTALIAIEKRQHAGQDGEVIAPNYEIFLKFLQEMNWSIVGSNMKVAVVNISIDFQQYFNYSRVSELNLFKIQSQLME